MKLIKEFLQDDVGREEDKTLALDLDGVVHKYSKGFHTGDLYDPPITGTKEALEFLSKKYTLVLFTTRALLHGTEDIVKWLEKYGLRKYFKKITYKKIPAIKYIDDKAVTFKSWSQVLGDLKKDNVI